MSLDKVRAVVEHLAAINPYANAKDLPEVPRPEEFSIPRQLPSLQQLPYVQNVLNTLSYNFLPRTFFCLEKHRSLDSIMITSKEILSEALPIRCLEATFVGLYLTHGMKGVDRIPLSFKSRAKRRTYHHIVLVIRCDGLYGALGLSRKLTLMDKPVVFSSLFDLIMEYKFQYEAIGHQLVDFKLGLCVSHEMHSRKAPCWRYIAVSFTNSSVLESLASQRVSDEAPADEGGRKIPEVGGVGELHLLAEVAQLLAHYAGLVRSISAHYERRAVPFIHGSMLDSSPISLRDLHEMEEAVAHQENLRRLEAVHDGRLPCPSVELDTKKRAASRSVSKKRYGPNWTAFSNTARPAAAKSSTVRNKGTAIKSIPVGRLRQEQQSLPQRMQKEELQQLPLVMEHTPSLLFSDTASGKLNSSGSSTQQGEGNSFTFSGGSGLPLIEARDSEFVSLADSHGGGWEALFVPRHELKDVGFFNLP
ncbi:vasohibin-1 [Trypanosoma rangeli]|uniref:Vasohibin-1 n=1 Tax=Trypanosoma rangeli TaxID=5698 RepID=A0A3R7KSD2_TRYRA|nr:vasohibin-1 [Trypanosoma rangeli]RNF08730.1 vasohibin-1 [Trypanosoma rangeli]|eukprot:RNF08730.1 vasohibin-1 [Trypanosoma rangeli]